MKQFLFLFFLLIGYSSTAQVKIYINYEDGKINFEPVEKSIQTDTSINLYYKGFPSQAKKAHFWFIIMPSKETYTDSDFSDKKNSIKSTSYIYKEGVFTCTINKEGNYKILLVKGSKSEQHKWWSLGTFTVPKQLSIEDGFQNQKTINLYPNPSDGVFTITPNDSISEIQILDQYGRSILKTSSTTFDLTNYPGGIYYVDIHNSDGTQIQRKIIKK